jgi:hypothetical protein
VFYLLEKTGIVHRLNLVNFQGPPCSVTVRCILNVSALTDADLLPVPAGVEAMVLDKCVEWFTGQRGMPADDAKDDNDINQKSTTR